MGTDPSISPFPEGELLRRWFGPLLENGTSWSADNLETTPAFLRFGEIELPLTVNDGEWENSWICSPWTHYIGYADEEIARALGPVGAKAAGALLAMLGAWLRRARINRVVMVNNWLLSTNPWPRWDGGGLRDVLAAMRESWPGHAIVFRSLNAKESASLLEALPDAGAFLIPSRQVWWYEPGSEAVWKSPDLRKDLRLLGRGDLEVVPHEAIGTEDIESLNQLYGRLYLEKYSRHNPRFTTAWFRHLHREHLAHFTGLRDPSGAWVGVEACCEHHGVLTSPVVGYDLSLPRSLGLYRRLAALPILEARRRGLPLNLSAGVGPFKSLRGGEPVMEFLAVFAGHLPSTRFLPWRAIHELSARLLAPYVQRHGL